MNIALGIVLILAFFIGVPILNYFIIMLIRKSEGSWN